MTLDPTQWPTTVAFEADDELGAWLWTYRVWNGWRPTDDLDVNRLTPETTRIIRAMRLAGDACRAMRGVFRTRSLT